MKVLFEPSGKPQSSIYISYCVARRERTYAEAVRHIINTTTESIDFGVFSRNSAKLMVASKMTRRGPFQGLRIIHGQAHDPQAILSRVWDAIGEPMVELKHRLLHAAGRNRSRMLVEIQEPLVGRIAADLWKMFKRMLPLFMGVNTVGLTAASKVLSSVFPEIALPVEKAQWREIFQTVDYTDIIMSMRAEISEWEIRSQKKLNHCDPLGGLTLPAFYNAVVMEEAAGGPRNDVQAMRPKVSSCFGRT